jgi:hypothetical protein
LSLLNFPNSPADGDVYSLGDRAWQFNGRGWRAYPGNVERDIRDLTISGALSAGGDVNVAEELNAGGDVNITGDLLFQTENPFTTTLQTVTQTANRVISFPDATGTVALVGGSTGQLLYNLNGAVAGLATATTNGTNLTLNGRLIIDTNGAASAPPLSLTGTWFTGGTSTTTKPAFLVEAFGAVSTAWSTLGTGLGVNAPSGFPGNLLDLQVNGTSNFSVSSAGDLKLGTSGGIIRQSVVFGDGYSIAGLQVNLSNIYTIGTLNVKGDTGLVFISPIIGIGGSTSGFPALKRSGAELQIRLANDSAYATIDAQLRSQGPAPATTGADGTVGDIRYDTDYIYVCTATNTWKRAALTTW